MEKYFENEECDIYNFNKTMEMLCNCPGPIGIGLRSIYPSLETRVAGHIMMKTEDYELLIKTIEGLE